MSATLIRMRIVITALFALSALVSNALTSDSANAKKKKILVGIHTSASYQVAVNGLKADTDLGNFAFKGYLQPSVGLALVYLSDSTEFATITLNAARLSYTLGSKNIISSNGNDYEITNRFDVFMNNYSLTASYNRRIAQPSTQNTISIETGMGLHYISEYSTLRMDDSLAGPYTVTTSLETHKKNYFLPSATLGFNMLLRPTENKAHFIFGINSTLFLDNLSEVRYYATYSETNWQLSYSFRWAPVLLMPRVSVMVVF